MISQPWHLLLVLLAGWVNREQQRVIDYLQTENQNTTPVKMRLVERLP